MVVGTDGATAAAVATDDGDALRSAVRSTMTSALVENASAAASVLNAMHADAVADGESSQCRCHYCCRPMTAMTTIWPIADHCWRDLAIAALW